MKQPMTKKYEGEFGVGGTISIVIVTGYADGVGAPSVKLDN